MNANPRPKVWHVGGEDVRLRIPLLLALRDRGFEVGAVGSEDGDDFLEHEIPYWRYSLDRWINPIADLKSSRQLYRLFKEHKPDVVHAFDTKPGLLAPAAAAKAEIPVRMRTICGMGYVFSSRSLLSAILRPVLQHLQRRGSKASTLTVFQNPDDRDYFRSHAMVEKGRDALVLGSGIDTDRLRAELPNEAGLQAIKRELGGEGRIVITMVARLVEQKGVKEYLQAARRIRQTTEKAVFLLVGPSSSEGRQAIPVAEVETYADDVKYLGRRGDVPALLAVSDLFVLPSYYREGVPRVLLEAGAIGLPLITTDMPGCKEVVRSGWNGWLVVPRDAAALADAIQQALSLTEDELRVMGERSRTHVEERFSLDRVADAYAEIYHAALACPRRLP